MAVREAARDGFSLLWRQMERLSGTLAKSKARDVNSEELREQTRETVQNYFRTARGAFLRLGIQEDDLADIDEGMQHLLKLASGRNPKASYLKVLRSLRKLRPTVEVQVEVASGKSSLVQSSVFSPSKIETDILATLEKMVPNAALSYRQVLQDLQSPGRVSFRGTAAELREVLREALDHLAPDADVMQAPGFRLEDGRTGPTMKQKAKFILKARGLSDTALKTSQTSLDVVEDRIAAVARSVYERGSVSTHVTSNRREISAVKMYAEAVLVELLQLYA